MSQLLLQLVVGTVWLPTEDKFSFRIKISFASTSPPSNDLLFTPLKLMKRIILSKLAGVFDPIGAGTDVLIKSKIAMQELWQLGLSGDEDVPFETRKKWVKLFGEINAPKDVKFDRCLTPAHVAGDPMLVVFCDDSRLAFGTCAYARWELQDGKFNARLIAAKSRVVPLKELTIPRLELQAAVLVSRLGKSILEESRLNFERVATCLTAELRWPRFKVNLEVTSPLCLLESEKYKTIQDLWSGTTVPLISTLLMMSQKASQQTN